MIFWIIAAGMALAVSALLAMALYGARGTDGPAEAYDIRVYRDQLAEIERDLARGTIAPDDAERAKTEVSRRILAADAAAPAAAHPARPGGGRITALLVAVALIGGSLGLYANMGAPGYGDLGLQTRIAMAADRRADRPAQAAAEASMPAPSAVDPSGQNAEYLALIDRLRATVAQRPDDIQGLELLISAEARLGNFAAAARGQEALVSLKGGDATLIDHVTLADLMILAAGGYVSPEAEDALRVALNMDASNGTARYYWGLMLAQTGRPDTAFRIWDALLRAGPPEAAWIGPIEAQIMDMAARAGVNYEMPAIGSGSGPTAADIAAAQDMTPGERMEMIRGMVGSLSDRLATEGGSADDWARLIMALGVLGERPRAIAILDEARSVFASDPASLDVLLRAAEQANLE